MARAFEARGIDSPRLCAELLLAHVIGCDRLRLYMESDRPASPLERQSLRGLVARALDHEPVQYLTGQAWFFGLLFHVDRRVLIPRPSSEVIVEQVLQHARVEPGFGGSAGQGALIADIGAGSGCLAIALLKNLPGARAVATDISPEALEVARDNARRLDVLDRLDLLEGNLLEPILSHPALGNAEEFHYLIANPPYIPDDEWQRVEANVRDHEPESALRGGADGLDLVEPILTRGPALVRPGGLILVEMPDSRAPRALELASARPDLADARIETDHEGLPRVVVARRVVSPS